MDVKEYHIMVLKNMLKSSKKDKVYAETLWKFAKKHNVRDKEFKLLFCRKCRSVELKFRVIDKRIYVICGSV